MCMQTTGLHKYAVLTHQCTPTHDALIPTSPPLTAAISHIATSTVTDELCSTWRMQRRQTCSYVSRRTASHCSSSWLCAANSQKPPAVAACSFPSHASSLVQRFRGSRRHHVRLTSPPDRDSALQVALSKSTKKESCTPTGSLVSAICNRSGTEGNSTHHHRPSGGIQQAGSTCRYSTACNQLVRLEEPCP